MKFQSIVILTSVAASTVQAGPPSDGKFARPLKDLDYNHGDSVHDKDQYEGRQKSDQARPLYGSGDEEKDCASYNNFPKFSGDGEYSHVPPHCREYERGWMVIKRQGGGPDGGRDANEMNQNGNVGVDDDGNGRIDDDGSDRIDGDGNGRNQDDNNRNDDNNSRYNDGDRPEDDGNGPEDDNNGRYDDGNGPDDDGNGRDNDGPRNSAGGKTIPLLGLVSMVAVSFLILM